MTFNGQIAGLKVKVWTDTLGTRRVPLMPIWGMHVAVPIDVHWVKLVS